MATEYKRGCDGCVYYAVIEVGGWCNSAHPSVNISGSHILTTKLSSFLLYIRRVYVFVSVGGGGRL